MEIIVIVLYVTAQLFFKTALIFAVLNTDMTPLKDLCSGDTSTVTIQVFNTCGFALLYVMVPLTGAVVFT